jgi:tetratricopeptide (TPR) repeat protein
MDPYLLLVVELLLYVLVVGGLSLMRREAGAYRLAGEALAWGVVLLGLAWVLRMPWPLLYLVALYLVTMRSRLLVELANALAAQRRPAALGRDDLALRLAGNPVDRALVRVNQGAALLHSGQVAAAAELLRELLGRPGLGLRLEAACRCNLGLAWLRQGQTERARAELARAIDLMPGSPYAQAARFALRRLDAPATDMT